MKLVHDLLLIALAGETTAEQTYLGYAATAIKEGLPGVAALFTGLSYSEAVHSANHKRALLKNDFTGSFPTADISDTAGTTLENLKAAISGEHEEFSAMYPSFKKQISRKHGNVFSAKVALLSIRWAMESEKNHHSLLLAAKRACEAGRDMNDKGFYHCVVCGNLVYEASAPTELCVVCGHDQSFFTKVEAAA